jgi:predicted aspartyl protease
MVDPGATVNVIRQSLVSLLNVQKTQTFPLKLADGTASKKPIGEIVWNICWNGQNEEVKLLVLENPSHPIILGTN